MLLELALEVVGPALLKTVAGEIAGALAIEGGKQVVRGVRKGEARLEPARLEHGRAVMRVVPTARVVSDTPGRLRFEVGGLRGRADLAAKLDEALGALPGVRAAEASARTGRVLVRFDPAEQTVESLGEAIEQVRSRHFADRKPTGRRLVAIV